MKNKIKYTIAIITIIALTMITIIQHRTITKMTNNINKTDSIFYQVSDSLEWYRSHYRTDYINY